MRRSLPESVTRALERYRFVSDSDSTQWTFEGHPSQSTRIVLRITENTYVLAVEQFAGGAGFDDEEVIPRRNEAALVFRIEQLCDGALQPYVKTRLQRWFEPWIGHDAAWALFRGKRR